MFEKKLKELLKESKMSASELSREIGIPRTTIQQWLTGSVPSIIQADKVATYFGLSLEELVFDRKSNFDIEDFLKEIHIHTGDYRLRISKIVKK